jgi:hypothetical protein
MMHGSATVICTSSKLVHFAKPVLHEKQSIGVAERMAFQKPKSFKVNCMTRG